MIITVTNQIASIMSPIGSALALRSLQILQISLPHTTMRKSSAAVDLFASQLRVCSPSYCAEVGKRRECVATEPSASSAHGKDGL